MTTPSRLAALTLATLLSASAATPDASTVDNLRAFAKLYGYVRFFHPSDEAAGVDWDAFAVYGAAKVMAVDAGGDLAAALRELFVPVAPTLRVFPAGAEPPPPAYDWPESTDGLEVVAWQHVGVGLGPGIYRSARSNRGDGSLLFEELPRPGERTREEIGLLVPAGLGLAVGLVGFVFTLGGLGLRWLALGWPVVLIVVGLAILARSLVRTRSDD
jgi:hypothetical protein